MSETNGFVTTNGSIGVDVVRPIQLEWQPQRDITPYELALCMRVLRSSGFYTRKLYEQLPAGAQRHFLNLTD